MGRKNCCHPYSLVQIDLATGTTSKQPEARRLLWLGWLDGLLQKILLKWHI
jgi:hypothetical protein